MPSSSCVIRPRGPKENMMAIEVVKGGEISGKSVMASKTESHVFGRPARVAVKAKRKPSSVPKVPTKVASKRLL